MDEWIKENVRLTGYTSDIYYYWGESDHSTTRMQGYYFAFEAYYGPDLYIDDDGEMPEEEGAYLVNDVPYCCGRPLKLVDNTYVCEFCGGEYDAEDEE